MISGHFADDIRQVLSLLDLIKRKERRWTSAPCYQATYHNDTVNGNNVVKIGKDLHFGNRWIGMNAEYLEAVTIGQFAGQVRSFLSGALDVAHLGKALRCWGNSPLTRWFK